MDAHTKSYQVMVRNIVFGVEDSLVSTVGFLAGIASVDIPQAHLLLTGLVLIVVEALSMGVGSLLSEASVEELHKAEADGRTIIVGGIIMFVSYFISGFIPLLPYLLLPRAWSFGVSIIASIGALFILGAISGRIGRGSPWKSALRMAILGGAAVAAGVLVARLVQT